MTGRALVRDLRRGVVYVASDVSSSGTAVTFWGQLRHRDAKGTRLYAPRLRTLPLAHVEIVWLDSANAEAVAA